MTGEQMMFPIAEEHFAESDRMGLVLEEFLEWVDTAIPGIPHGRDDLRLELRRAHPDEESLAATMWRMRAVIARSGGQVVFQTLSEFLREANNRINMWTAGHARDVLTIPALTLLLNTSSPLAHTDGVRLVSHFIDVLGGHPEGRADAVEFTEEEAGGVVRVARSVARPGVDGVYVGDVIVSAGLPRLLALIRDNPVLSDMPVEWSFDLVVEMLRDAYGDGSAMSSALRQSGLLDGAT